MDKLGLVTDNNQDIQNSRPMKSGGKRASCESKPRYRSTLQRQCENDRDSGRAKPVNSDVARRWQGVG